MQYQPRKRIWTDADYTQMGWHDCHIYQIRLGEDLELDIDYILQWNKPDLEGLGFTFWVSPATLVFKAVSEVKFDLNTFSSQAFEIDSIEKEGDQSWVIITQQGHMEFNAIGFEQYIRQDPFFEFGQTIPLIDRYGLSLEKTTQQENPNRTREDCVLRRKKDLEDYETAKKRHLKKLEMERLLQARENDEIETKAYLLKKKEISEWLFSYDYFLKGTLFENW